jgi:hypothetical protein
MAKIAKVDHCGRRAELGRVARGAGITVRSSSGSLVLCAALVALAPAAAAGETRCWIDKGALVAAASFGGIAGDFLIDLSAPVSQLHVTRAQEAGIENNAAEGELRIAGQRVVGFEMTVTDLDTRTAAFDTTINGVIGADLLSRFIVEIDPAPCRLRLWRRSPGRLAGAVGVPVRMQAGRPSIDALVTDGVTVRSRSFAIDTADWQTRVPGARLSRPKPDDKAAHPIRLRALEIGGELFEQVPTAAPGPADPDEGAIGMAVGSARRLRLDLARGRLELAPLTPPAILARRAITGH